jgi:hypothetical protein
MSTILKVHVQVTSLEHLKELGKNPYNYGEYLVTDSGEIFLVDEAEEIIDEIESGQVSYSINWESEIWTESGIQVPAVYTE